MLAATAAAGFIAQIGVGLINRYCLCLTARRRCAGFVFFGMVMVTSAATFIRLGVFR